MKRIINGREYNIAPNSDLSGCDLSESNLSRCNLRESNLSRCNLRESNLRWCDLRGCNLGECDLRGCNLSGCNLRGCNLSESNLRWSDLRGAKINSKTKLGNPFRLLECNWGLVSDELCYQMMLIDADSIPNGKKLFSEWADGGNCPYGSSNFIRACLFKENKDVWVKYKGTKRWPVATVIEKLLKEKCEVIDE